MITVRVFLAEDQSSRVEFFQELRIYEFQGYRFEPYTIHRFDKRPDYWTLSFLAWEGPSILFLDFDFSLLLKDEALRSLIAGLDELRASRIEAERWFVQPEMIDSTAIALTRFKNVTSHPFLLVGASTYMSDEPWAAIRSSLTEVSTVTVDHLRQCFQDLWPHEIGIGEFFRHSTKPIAAYRGRRFQKDLNYFPEAQRALTEAALAFVWAFSEKGDFWDLDFRDWQMFRDLLWQESSQWSKRLPGVRHERWAHHLRGGGYDYDPNLLPTILFDYFLSTARNVAPQFNASRMKADQLEWGDVQDDKHSPWRAACQFDGGGRDLSSALQGILRAQCDVVDVRVEFNFAADLALFGDCLWCNGVGIARHVNRIARCFADLVRFQGERGVFSVVASLSRKGEGAMLCELQLRVFQSINGECEPLPNPAKATGKVSTAYDALRQCGSGLEVDDRGVLYITIAGKIEMRIDATDNIVPFFVSAM